MTKKFASSKKAIAECDVCGFQFKLRELRSKVVRGRDTNILACPECFDFAGRDSSRNVQWGWNPVGDGNNFYGLSVNKLAAVGAIGEVTVTTS